MFVTLLSIITALYLLHKSRIKDDIFEINALGYTPFNYVSITDGFRIYSVDCEKRNGYSRET